MTGPDLPAIRALLTDLEAARGRPAIFFQSALYDQAVLPLYECLRQAGPVDALDLVLSTGGGTITSTRQIAMLLREFARDLTILVPYRARSAGTLLCLSADALVLGPLAELGPIDATMDSDGAPVTDSPGTISAQDIRAFRSMAEEWFGAGRPQDRIEVLGLLATRFFPTALSSFYRFDRLAREVAAELLAWQLPGQEQAAAREQIVDRLVGGYHSHSFVLSRRDVAALGLRAADATAREEPILWALARAVPRPAEARTSGTGAVIVSAGFSAAEVVLSAGDHGAGGPGPGGQGPGEHGRLPVLGWKNLD